jgi:glutamate synthase (NADPH/NADH) large chain
MTGGTVVVLGETGRNFAAGMSGGIAYVYDPDGTFAGKCNKSMVALDPVLQQAEQERTVDRALWHTGQTDEALLKGLVERHFQFTGSPRAKALLENWDAARRQFVKVFPTEYKRALGELGAKKANQEELAA